MVQANQRPDIHAAIRGGDESQRMDGEGLPRDATREQALYWRQIYVEILSMEEKVLVRIRQLMATQSDEGRREVELTNVPVFVAQVERFRKRLGYWDGRLAQLGTSETLRALTGQNSGSDGGSLIHLIREDATVTLCNAFELTELSTVGDDDHICAACRDQLRGA